MFRASFVILALASVLALNGCSKCSSQNNEAPPAATEAPAAPAEGQPAPEQAPAEGQQTAPAAEQAPAEGTGH